jgi:hypothetical protein
MQRSFIDPLTPRAVQEAHFDISDLVLAKALGVTPINTCIKTLNEEAQLLELLGGSSHRYSMLDGSSRNDSCFRHMHHLRLPHQTIISQISEVFSPLGPVLRGKYREYYEEGLKLLDILTRKSPLSLKGRGL